MQKRIKIGEKIKQVVVRKRKRNTGLEVKQAREIVRKRRRIQEIEVERFVQGELSIGGEGYQGELDEY